MKRYAMIGVDIDNDFCPGGALAVPDGDKVIVPLNKFGTYIWLCGGMLFASTDRHPQETNHFQKFPVHCVEGTRGAEFHPDFDLRHMTILVKGQKKDEDAFSAFDGVTSDGRTLEEILNAEKITHLYIGGLATDYCVKATVLDALKKGFKVTLLIDACRAVNMKPNDGADALNEMEQAGAILKTTTDVMNEK